MTEKLQSTKLIFGALLAISATVAMMTGKMDIQQWTEYTTYVFGIYAGGNALATIGAGIAGVLNKTKPGNGNGGTK